MEIEKIKKILSIDEELSVRGSVIREAYKPELKQKLVKKFRAYVDLPEPEEIKIQFTDVVKRRRSARFFGHCGVSASRLSTLLYHVVGVTERVDGIYGLLDYPLRASPSAGGLHCVDIYVAALWVEGLEPGVYYYDYDSHRLGVVCRCYPHTLTEAFMQESLRDVPLVLYMVAALERGLWKYDMAYYKMCLIDAGAVAENLHLSSTALGLGSLIVAGFDRQRVKKILGLEEHEIPIVAVVVGCTR